MSILHSRLRIFSMNTFRNLHSITSFSPDEGDAYENDPLFMRSVARAVAVISAFQNARHPLSLSQIATAAGINRSAAQRIVYTYMKLGMIARDPEDRGYLPGLRSLDITHDFLRLNPMLLKANQIMLALRRQVGERVDLSIFDDVRVVYAVRMPSKNEIFNATLVGHAVPTYCTAGGVAILSCLPDHKIADIVARSDLTPFTPHTMRTVEEVMEQVRAARERGHSVLSRQLLNHEIVVGAPILDSSGAPVGALHLAGSLQEWTAEDFSNKFGPLVQDAAQIISEKPPRKTL